MKFRLAAIFSFVLALTIPALAQTPGGTVTGSVRDEQGAVIPGSEVTLTGSDATFRFTTTAEGTFRFLDLAPGSYKVSAALTGFQPADARCDRGRGQDGRRTARAPRGALSSNR